MKNLKTLSKVIVAAGMTALAVACSKGSSNSNPVVNPGLYPNGCLQCVGGVGGGTVATAQFQTPMQEAIGTISIMSSQGGVGQVSVTGQLQVTGQNPSYLCGLPAGVYPIQTAQPGMLYSSGIISNLVFQAGPLTFQVQEAELNNPSGANYRFAILYGSVNCGSVVTN